MESSASDNDSVMQVDKVESTEEYDALEWQDKSCLESVKEPDVVLASRSCYACRNLFSGSKAFQTYYKHYYYLSSLRSAADRGCHLCVLLRSKVDRETQNHRPSEVLRLTVEIYPSSIKHDGNAFELWFHFFKIPKRAGYGNTVWGIKRINFLPTEDFDQAAIYGHQLTPSSRSWENRLLANQWLSTCTKKHDSCNHSETCRNWSPTRLLNVSLVRSTESSINLVECTAKHSDLRYVTLSHCWGHKSILMLTQNNIERLKKSIPISDLPRTFQDAVMVAATWFQCDFLWIDSLCIIQDSAEDWQKESAEMRHVYKNAWLNIAATGATDSFGGLFFNRNPSMVSSGLTPIHWEGGMPKGTFRFFLSDIWADGVSRAPLNRRAWVVQERFLARRNLHFGSQSLYFECHEMEACEAFPGGLPQSLRKLLVNGFKDIPQPTNPRTSDRIASFLRSWQKIVSAYMDCDLTYASDKMIALSGVADEFRNISNDVYVAGLFNNDFLTEQLMWQVIGKKASGQPSTRPPVYRAPSWSWLSLDAKIACPLIFQPSFIEILQVKIWLVSERNPTGQVNRGVLSIKAHLKCISLRKIPDTRAYFHIFDENSNDIGGIRVHFDTEANRPTQVYCMPVRILFDNELEGLLLVPTGKTHMEFNRVAHFTSDDANVLQRLAQQRHGERVNFTIV